MTVLITHYKIVIVPITIWPRLDLVKWWRHMLILVRCGSGCGQVTEVLTVNLLRICHCDIQRVNEVFDMWVLVIFSWQCQRTSEACLVQMHSLPLLLPLVLFLVVLLLEILLLLLLHLLLVLSDPGKEQRHLTATPQKNLHAFIAENALAVACIACIPSAT